ncbi:hypothetical protein FRB99_007712 [Tulasnella sp. 403]|nr:hypothetical protein FRB99_007712 [Tulasnella sp. 403]
MDHTFRFILEEPNTGSSKGQNNRKRARLVTACDNCRVKKIKCIRTSQLDSEAPCEACKLGNTDCSYSDRDRYQNERGLSFASTVPPITPTPRTPVTEDPSRKRKASSVSSPDDRIETSEKRRNSNADLIPPRQPTPSSINSYTKVLPPLITNLPPEPSPDPGLKRITVPFFRYFGPTANTPGYRRVKVRTLTLNEAGSPGSSSPDSMLPATEGEGSHNINYPYRQRVHPDGHPFPFNTEATTTTNSPPSSNTSGWFDAQRPRYPSSKYLPHLAELFFDHLACHFPFLDREEVMEAVGNGTLPAVLANCIASLACRFSDCPDLIKGGKRSVAGEAFTDMSKLLIVHKLSWPSVEVVQALVLTAWAEFGSGRDSGLWMYSRMAVAMAMDLGLQFESTVQLATTETAKENIRLTWWSVLLIDRINSWGTGRPIAIADNQFDIALPFTPLDPNEDISQPPPPTLVFAHLASLVQLRGKMGDVLNNLVKKNADTIVEMELSQLQYEMTAWYQNLTPSLVFSIHNFRRFSHHKQAPIFLLLHCMFHSVVALLHRPSLLQCFTPEVTMPLANSIDLSRSSARSLADMVSLADEIDTDSLIANPFLDLPILTAARGFLAEREFLNKPPDSMSPMSVLLMRQWSDTALGRCKDALKKMAKYWGGVGCVKRILDQQSVGNLDFDVGEGSSGDTHVAHLRDVELITQWATKAWRRHTAVNKDKDPQPRLVLQTLQTNNMTTCTNASGPSSGIHLADQSPATSPTTATMAPGNGSPNAVHPNRDSPAGATVGISGVLDSPFTHGAEGSGLSTYDGPLRVMFNSAEADLSFPNLNSTELFNIPDGLEEFLGGALDMPGQGPGTGGLELPSNAGALLGNNGAPMENPLAPITTLINPWFSIVPFSSRAPSPNLHGQK